MTELEKSLEGGNRVAPAGQVYVCGACGKTSRDRYGFHPEHSYGWDESCMLNAILCGSTKNPDGEWVAVDEF